ncbi:hypothetical protein FQA39_LY11752 [Lamprigera yunnana]|nr:hypothetical protein FQA39_LY11752 [Lamprigera yunnana]
MSNSEGESMDGDKRKSYETEDDTGVEGYVLTKKEAQKNEEKLDKILDMLQQLTLDVNQIKLDQRKNNKIINELKEENEKLWNKNINIKKHYEVIIKKAFLVDKNLPLKVWISEDATRITGRIQYDASTNQIVGLVQKPNSLTGFPDTFSYPSESASQIENFVTSNHVSSLAYVNMAQPFNLNAPSCCLPIYGKNNKFTGDEVLLRWRTILKQAEYVGIEVLGVSSYGDSCLSCGGLNLKNYSKEYNKESLLQTSGFVIVTTKCGRTIIVRKTSLCLLLSESSLKLSSDRSKRVKQNDTTLRNIHKEKNDKSKHPFVEKEKIQIDEWVDFSKSDVGLVLGFSYLTGKGKVKEFPKETVPVKPPTKNARGIRVHTI